MRYPGITFAMISSLALLSVPAFQAIHADSPAAGDVSILVRELESRHANLYHSIDTATLSEHAQAVSLSFPALEADERLFRLACLINLVGDAHTRLDVWPGYRPFPFVIYWFSDGLYVTHTVDEYSSALGARLYSIDGRPVEDVLSLLRPGIPAENDAGFRHIATGYLTHSGILRGAGITRGDSAEFTFLTVSGETISMRVAARSSTQPIPWVSAVDYTTVPTPLANTRSRRFYWHANLADSSAIYFQYDKCADQPGESSVVAYTAQLLRDIDRSRPERLIVDLRFNGGGNSALLRPFINGLAERNAQRTMPTVYVLIGRQTFSSAILNAIELQRAASAIYVGEPSGGRPNHFGFVDRFRLPGIGLDVLYSKQYFEYLPNYDRDALYPDFPAPVSFHEMSHGIDPPLAAAMRHRSGQ